ncbi:MAG: hypothetical protein Q8K67_13545 [Geothrix sp.]|nr:hypothetical protein [Geothrix sp.]
MNRTWKWATSLLGFVGSALLTTLVLLGCGGGKGATDTAQYYGNYHPAGWISAHGGQAVAGVAACTKCHEISLLRVGSGIPTCLTTGCHHQSVPGWANSDIHGMKAKLAAGTTGGSLASCQICHAKDFSGGASANACVTCHGVKAPHPAKPWRTSAGSLQTHVSTDPSNAAVCAQCHFPGSPSNPAGYPAVPAPAGTQPGCYNATLCHANSGAPHALGAIWKDPTSAAFHGIEAKKDLKYCQSCHGTPGTTKFDGGTAATACSSCHSKTTGAGAHSTTWWNDPVQTFPGYVPGHRNATNPLSTTGSCVICHAVTSASTSTLTAAPSCYSASFGNSEHAALSCHANGPAAANHPIPYIDATHTTVTQAQFNAACINCHAVSGTSPVSAAPLCATCHKVASPLAAGTAAGTCLSCHSGPAGLPVGPTGAAFPSIAGAHAKHMALPNVSCASCHSGIGAGSLTHYNAANARVTPPASPAPVAIAATFNAQTGAATFSTSALTCSTSSCHGGQATPNWQTGALALASAAATSNTYCASCHASGTTQFNSYNSGQHSKHSPAYCADCHNVLSGATQTSHWANLQTSTMEGPASATIQFSAAATGARTYTASNKNCTLTCHFPDNTTRDHAPETW